MKYLILPFFLFFLLGCESGKRKIKDISSNLTGGLNRICTVYSLEGSKIKSYEGKFDLKFGDNRMFFDKDGKRTVIIGGTIICDEN